LPIFQKQEKLDHVKQLKEKDEHIKLLKEFNRQDEEEIGALREEIELLKGQQQPVAVEAEAQANGADSDVEEEEESEVVVVVSDGSHRRAFR
jgi:hypothetical protein